MTKAILLCALLLSGCATRPDALANRLACTMPGDQAFVVSMWGVVGIASKLSDEDTTVVCP